MEIKIGDAVRQKRAHELEQHGKIGIVLRVIDKSSTWFPTADILYPDDTIGWSYLMDLEVISESR